MSDNAREQSGPGQAQPASGKKRPYRTPQLTVHGGLKDLTRATAKGGGNVDGGKPSTRAGGPPS